MSLPPFSGRTTATPDCAGRTAAETEHPADSSALDPPAPAEPTLLEQMGGWSGLVYSTLPVLAFVPVNSFVGLSAAIWAALGVAAAVLLWRLVRREPVQPAVSGFVGVAVCAFIAYRLGSAKGFFLFGIYASLLYAAVLAASIVVRWPLAGVVWSVMHGDGHEWRQDRRAVRFYDVATLAWAVVFLARYLVQHHFYNANQTGALALARIGMGWPLTAVAALVTVWAVRRASRSLEAGEDGAEAPVDQDDLDTESLPRNRLMRPRNGSTPGRHSLR
ncbi:MAG: DUF3159 domain-containing protein [Mycobacterium sp.]|nr:DUF3159 domain-containing protein [Mycobacterium sp.]